MQVPEKFAKMLIQEEPDFLNEFCQQFFIDEDL